VNAARRSQGLIGKFNVSRVDGSDAAGGRHEGCRYFVLDMTHDRHAIPALRSYADSCEADYPALARDLRQAAAELEASPAAPDQEGAASKSVADEKIDRIVDAAREETERGRAARRQP
jgi:erythromycin esterase-like protein